ncbi:putative F-box/FBD/LRR-repeat protein At5g22610 [Setaria viridis]|uniref:putative F-box/FBD/LRR-repeat protein At5g22610 n=1 Tax=Setaria viridis TaxID=4556 RepID=UPI0014936C9F|nr:putative F-box/FBD/LRR-repeat protein At5g22610 [Setaria viridis]
MEPPAFKRRGVDDHISALPDELLIIILLALRSTAAAARTSVLSRRWRRVWTYLSELDLSGSSSPATTTSSAHLDAIDAALNSYSAPTLHHLKIDLRKCDIPAHRVAPWTRFASQRLTGRIYIHLPWQQLPKAVEGTMEELALPVCERATEIDISLGMNFVLRPPPTGSFTALTDQMITSTYMDGGELGRVVSTQCRRLRTLYLDGIRFVATYRVSICSESLECLVYSTSYKG